MKQIKQFPQYSIDESGTIIINNETGTIVTIGDQLINKKPSGYKYVTLRGYPYKWIRISVHRLVAMTYIDNPNNYPEVNHIDGNKANNHISNLEWCTHQQNIQHSFDNGRITPKGVDSKRYGQKHTLATKNLQREAKLGDKHPKFKGVYYVFYKPYNSSMEAYKATNICSRTIIRRCKKGKPGTDYYFVPK